jgi:hypothetical protein
VDLPSSRRNDGALTTRELDMLSQLEADRIPTGHLVTFAPDDDVEVQKGSVWHEFPVFLTQNLDTRMPELLFCARLHCLLKAMICPNL